MSDVNPDLNLNPGPPVMGVVAPAVPMPPEVMGVPLPQDRPPGAEGARPDSSLASKAESYGPRKLPLYWQRWNLPPWAHACLAAAAAGWDPRQESGEVTERQYDDALRVAQALLEKCRQDAPQKAHGDSFASRRVVINPHPNAMTAVVALKPSVAELPAILQGMHDDNATGAQRQNAQAQALWSRVLWPDAGGQQVIIDEYPIDYLLHWPNAYIASLVVSGSDVRKKL